MMEKIHARVDTENEANMDKFRAGNRSYGSEYIEDSVLAGMDPTGLDGGTIDLVLCAQTFHWFRQGEAVEEFARALRPGGRLALMWNSRSRQDPLTLGYIEAIHAVNGEHPAETRTFDPDVVSAIGRFSPPRLARFDHAQTLDRPGLVG